MPDAGEAMAVVAESQDLAAPHGVVASITGAVEGHTDDRLAQHFVLGEQRHHMRVMVLDQIEWAIARVVFGPVAGRVARVKVGGQSSGHPRMSQSCRTLRVNAFSVATEPISPICPEQYARRPSVRQNVFLSSPPTASTGGLWMPRSTGRGA